jgi:hypothetical protein
VFALLLLMAAPQAPDASPPGLDANVPVLPQPRKDKPIDPATTRLVIDRLVELHLLDDAAAASDPAKLTAAIKGFQSGIGRKANGVLDHKTLALMAL